MERKNFPCITKSKRQKSLCRRSLEFPRLKIIIIIIIIIIINNNNDNNNNYNNNNN